MHVEKKHIPFGTTVRDEFLGYYCPECDRLLRSSSALKHDYIVCIRHDADSARRAARPLWVNCYPATPEQYLTKKWLADK